MESNEMLPELPPETSSALQLIRCGRFYEAAAVLQKREQTNNRPSTRTDPLTMALLADALQRIGQNDRAEAIAKRTLQTESCTVHVSARCHFVLGNVQRDRGNPAKAIEHLQIASTATGS